MNLIDGIDFRESEFVFVFFAHSVKEDHFQCKFKNNEVPVYRKKRSENRIVIKSVFFREFEDFTIYKGSWEDVFNKLLKLEISAFISVLFFILGSDNLVEGILIDDEYRKILENIRNQSFKGKIRKINKFKAEEVVDLLPENEKFNFLEKVWFSVLTNQVHQVLNEMINGRSKHLKSDFYIIFDNSYDIKYKKYFKTSNGIQDIFPNLKILQGSIGEDKIIVIHKDFLKIVVDVNHSVTWAKIFSKPHRQMDFSSSISMVVSIDKELPCVILQLTQDQERITSKELKID